MKRQLLVAAGLSVFAVGVAGAQQASCPPGSVVTVGGIPVPDRQRASQDACQMASDVFQFIAPQLGLALAGGNATLGVGSTLGGLGHFSIGVRGNVFNGDVPEISKFRQPGTSGATQGNLQTKSQILGLPTADAEIGLFSGIPLGLTNVGGVDALVSASYVPSYGKATSDVMVRPDQNFQIGYGARIGILQESIIVPGVSLTYIKRDLPNTTIFGTSPNLDVNITNAKVETSAWRVVAGKSFLLFGVVVGAGQDTYKQSATVQATARGTAVGTQTSDPIGLTRNMTRTNMFADLSLNLPLFKIVGEVGNSTGSADSSSFNTFTTATDKSRLYGSLGIRLGM